MGQSHLGGLQVRVSHPPTNPQERRCPELNLMAIGMPRHAAIADAQI
jgi:hypothetical protein